MRRSPPRLIAELVTLTTADGRSLSELARELAVDETTLMQYRSGRRPISMKSYARIMRRFAANRLIRDLAIHYAAVEYHAADRAPDLHEPESLPHSVVLALRQYVERFAEESLRGARGLYFIGSDRELTAVAQFVERLFESANVRVCRLRADKKPAASEVRNALAAPLLVLERTDFACNEVIDVIRRRAELVRPVIVTSTERLETIADAYLKRILRASTRPIEIEKAVQTRNSNSPELHATT